MTVEMETTISGWDNYAVIQVVVLMGILSTVSYGACRVMDWLWKRRGVFSELHQALKFTPYGTYTNMFEYWFIHVPFALKAPFCQRQVLEDQIQKQLTTLFQLPPPESSSRPAFLLSHSCRTLFYCIIQTLLDQAQAKTGRRRIRIATVAVHFGSFYKLIKSMNQAGDEIEFYEIDLDPVDWTVKHDQIQEAQIAQCHVIFHQNLFGVPLQQDKLLDLGRKLNLLIVEDCVQSGSMYGNYKGDARSDVVMWSGGFDKTPSCLGAGIGHYRPTPYGDAMFDSCQSMMSSFALDQHRMSTMFNQLLHLGIAKNSFSVVLYLGGLVVAYLLKREDLQLHDMAFCVRTNKSVTPFQSAKDKFCHQPSNWQLLSMIYGIGKQRHYEHIAREEVEKRVLLLQKVPSQYHATIWPWLTPENLDLHQSNLGVSEFTWIFCAPEERVPLIKFLSKHGLIVLINTTWEHHTKTQLVMGKRICEGLVYLPNLNEMSRKDVLRMAEVVTMWCEGRKST
eukprot:CAMPEP_0172439490 /NCGR_PEP_ID=MMETSP1065-20121228/460_1 /TAXON_ID=265537 /ORGANISM="Amphiprora paludosa, Strain CCMP125" /LENGTH=505 /DNA_ID=CAMNT_0013188177 /DNA_START=77 /DNA_END=1594 /DNA_ORIENTATION=-